MIMGASDLLARLCFCLIPSERRCWLFWFKLELEVWLCFLVSD